VTSAAAKFLTVPLALLVLTAAATATPGDGQGLHFGLARSIPADSAMVQSVPEVRLWFTEVPAERTVTVRVLGGDGAPLPTGALVQDADDGRAFQLPLQGSLASGRYTVAWRGMGTDGHVVQGMLSFTVAAP